LAVAPAGAVRPFVRGAVAEGPGFVVHPLGWKPVRATPFGAVGYAQAVPALPVGFPPGVCLALLSGPRMAFRIDVRAAPQVLGFLAVGHRSDVRFCQVRAEAAGVCFRVDRGAAGS